jgi:hypothetical protein
MKSGNNIQQNKKRQYSTEEEFSELVHEAKIFPKIELIIILSGNLLTLLRSIFESHKIFIKNN